MELRKNTYDGTVLANGNASRPTGFYNMNLDGVVTLTPWGKIDLHNSPNISGIGWLKDAFMVIHETVAHFHPKWGISDYMIDSTQLPPNLVPKQALYECSAGPSIPHPQNYTSGDGGTCNTFDKDNDNDVDSTGFGAAQRCFIGDNIDLNCLQ